jgi:hypothetical protein
MTIIKKKKFKHSDNIKQILQNIPFLELLAESEANYYFAGGFTTALLFAPREFDLNNIQKHFYDDIDLFFPTLEDFNKAQNLFHEKYGMFNIVSTENAETYEFYENSRYTKIQFVKKMFAAPEELLKTFDFVNCTTAYDKLNDTWYIHERTIEAMVNRKLTLNNPVMLDPSFHSYPQSIFLQLERIQKYKKRYNLDLDLPCMMKLLKVNQRSPDVTTEILESNRVLGWYKYYTKSFKANKNIWTLFSHLLNRNPLWKHFENKFKNIEPKGEELEDII